VFNNIEEIMCLPSPTATFSTLLKNAQASLPTLLKANQAIATTFL